MAIVISPETQALIEWRMKELGHTDVDQFLQIAVGHFDPHEVFDFDDLDSETRAAIEIADSQPDIPLEEAERRIFNRSTSK